MRDGAGNVKRACYDARFLRQPTMSTPIRPMLGADLAAVLKVQAACYPPAMQETAAVVAARRQAAAATCLVAEDADGVCGYLFAYPSRRGLVTALDAPFCIAPDADTLYLHDLAVAPRALGRGLARSLVQSMLALGRAHGLAHAALVAVQDSARFWRAQGFEVQAGQYAGLAGYPAGSLYMLRTPL